MNHSTNQQLGRTATNTRLRVSRGAFAIAAVVLLLGVGASTAARADVVAAYLQGYGGVANQTNGGSDGVSAGGSGGPALGVQAGARFLIFEAYADHTVFGNSVSVSRGIVGLRAALELGGFRLVLRGGGGAIDERGGALTGRLDGGPERVGVVARAGAALERKFAPTLLGGLGLEGEVFNVGPLSGTTINANGTTDRISGSDVFLSFHLKFEIGI